MLSVRFESAELPHIPHHQGRRAECIAPFFFVCILTIWELEECLIYIFRRGIDEWSICFWWVFSQLSFRATWRTKGGMPSTVLCLFPMFFLNIEDIRTRGVSHFCVGEVSMNVRSVLGELWVSWVSHIITKKPSTGFNQAKQKKVRKCQMTIYINADVKKTETCPNGVRIVARGSADTKTHLWVSLRKKNELVFVINAKHVRFYKLLVFHKSGPGNKTKPY